MELVKKFGHCTLTIYSDWIWTTWSTHSTVAQ
jgi:hypothetical protein